MNTLQTDIMKRMGNLEIKLRRAIKLEATGGKADSARPNFQGQGYKTHDVQRLKPILSKNPHEEEKLADKNTSSPA